MTMKGEGFLKGDFLRYIYVLHVSLSIWSVHARHRNPFFFLPFI